MIATQLFIMFFIIVFIGMKRTPMFEWKVYFVLAVSGLLISVIGICYANSEKHAVPDSQVYSLVADSDTVSHTATKIEEESNRSEGMVIAYAISGMFFMVFLLMLLFSAIPWAKVRQVTIRTWEQILLHTFPFRNDARNNLENSDARDAAGCRHGSPGDRSGRKGP